MSSISGAQQPVALGSGKFIKHYNLPVLMIKIKGGYLTNTKYCLHCGCSIVDTVSSNYDVDNIEANDLIAQSLSRAIDIRNVLRNWWMYSKSFFTNATTKAQQAFHFTGIITLVFFVITFCRIVRAPVSEEDVTLLSGFDAFAIVIFVCSLHALLITFIIFASVKIKHWTNRVPISTSRYSRWWLQLISNVLLVFGSTFLIIVALPDNSGKSAIMLFIIFVLWSLTFRFYAHCPRQCKEIQIGNKLIKKQYTPIATAIASLVCFAIMVIWFMAQQ